MPSRHPETVPLAQPCPAQHGLKKWLHNIYREAAIFKNVASQKIAVYAFDSTTGAPKTGDAANITVYVSKDGGAVTALGDTSATEQDATNAKGLYQFDLTQAETNADNLQFSGKSTTSNTFIVARWIDTLPNRFTTLVIDAAGLADANTVKLGPTGSGTAQTARDIGASVIAASVTAGVTVTTNNDKTGYALTSGERNSVADAMLDRDMSTGADSGSTTVRTVRQALRFLRNKWAIAAGTLTVYKEDDATSSWTAAVATDAAALPIISNDPAGP